MFDQRLRRQLDPSLERMAGVAHHLGVSASILTAAGFVLGLLAAVFVGLGWWWVALVAWLTSRFLDGLDGAVARIEGPTARGGYLDLMADFTVYAAFVIGVAVAVPDARLAAVVVVSCYYVSGAAFLAWASLSRGGAAPHPDGGLALDDNRSVRFVGGLAEGFETIATYALLCLFPANAAPILWVFAAVVAITAGQRIAFAVRDLRGRAPTTPQRDQLSTPVAVRSRR